MKTRRSFLKSTFFTTSLFVMSGNKVFASLTPLETLKVVQTDLFPQDMIQNANAFAYLSIVLNHSRITEENKQFLRNGVKWLNEEAAKKYKKIYTELNSKERQTTLQIIAKESWGESWIKTVLGYIMEAVLGDPIYGINKKQSGWKWLKFEGGLPRPKEALL